MEFLKSSIQRLMRRSARAETESVPDTRLLLQGNWVIPGRLLVGPRPRTAQQVLFAQLGVRGVLTLHSEVEAPLPDWLSELQHRCFYLPDSHVAAALTVTDLAAAVDTLAVMLEEVSPVYCHCLAGIERSPLVCLGYLGRYRGMTLTSALNHLQQMHPRTCPTDAQMAVLRQYLDRTR